MNTIDGLIIMLFGLCIMPIYWLQLLWQTTDVIQRFCAWHVFFKRVMIVYGGATFWFLATPMVYQWLGTASWGFLSEGEIFLFRAFLESFVALVGMNVFGLLASFMLSLSNPIINYLIKLWILMRGFSYRVGHGSGHNRLTVNVAPPPVAHTGASGGGRSMSKKAEARMAALAKAETEMKNHQVKTAGDNVKAVTSNTDENRAKRRRGQH
jgi:hypothetical protein